MGLHVTAPVTCLRSWPWLLHISWLEARDALNMVRYPGLPPIKGTAAEFGLLRLKSI